ncbi:MAG: AMP-binding protein, partial [Vulcanimicrobiaceae bacterium]
METLPQFLAPALAQARDRAIGERVAGDSWSFLSTAQLRRRVDSIACALRANEIGAGDRVALIAQNCVDWVVADLGIVFAGCVCVPIFSTGALDQMQYILADCGAKLAFVERTADAARLRAAISQAPPIVAFDDPGPDGLAAFERAGAALLAADPQAPERLRAPIRPGDLAVLIYTSGTTGDPKGVMLTH